MNARKSVARTQRVNSNGTSWYDDTFDDQIYTTEACMTPTHDLRRKQTSCSENTSEAPLIKETINYLDAWDIKTPEQVLLVVGVWLAVISKTKCDLRSR